MKLGTFTFLFLFGALCLAKVTPIVTSQRVTLRDFATQKIETFDVLQIEGVDIEAEVKRYPPNQQDLVREELLEQARATRYLLFLLCDHILSYNSNHGAGTKPMTLEQRLDLIRRLGFLFEGDGTLIAVTKIDRNPKPNVNPIDLFASAVVWIDDGRGLAFERSHFGSDPTRVEARQYQIRSEPIQVLYKVNGEIRIHEELTRLESSAPKMFGGRCEIGLMCKPTRHGHDLLAIVYRMIRLGHLTVRTRVPSGMAEPMDLANFDRRRAIHQSLINPIYEREIAPVRVEEHQDPVSPEVIAEHERVLLDIFSNPMKQSQTPPPAHLIYGDTDLVMVSEIDVWTVYRGLLEKFFKKVGFTPTYDYTVPGFPNLIHAARIQRTLWEDLTDVKFSQIFGTDLYQQILLLGHRPTGLYLKIGEVCREVVHRMSHTLGIPAVAP